MTTSQEWIEQSLARLEQAEAEREHHEQALEAITDPDELRAHSEAIDRLDEEVAGLYTKLEAAAAEAETDDAGEEPPPPSSPQAAPRPESAPMAAAAPERQFSVQPAPPDYDPFGPPPGVDGPAAVSTPAPALAAGAGFGSMTDFTPTHGDLDEPRPGSGLKWMVAAVMVVGGGGLGAYTMMNSADTPRAPVADPGPTEVISATPVPPDTQGPRVAKGGDADRTPGTAIRRSGKVKRGGGGGGKATRESGDDSSGLKVQDTKDPLAGLDD